MIFTRQKLSKGFLGGEILVQGIYWVLLLVKGIIFSFMTSITLPVIITSQYTPSQLYYRK